MALVELVTNGGANASVGRVSLTTADGSAGFHFRTLIGSKPTVDEEHGRSITTTCASPTSTRVRDDELVLRASVGVGSRPYRSRRSISVACPAAPP